MVNLLMKDLQALCIKHSIDIIDVEGLFFEMALLYSMSWRLSRVKLRSQ